MKTYYYLLILFFLYGCANEKKQNVEYVSATYELLDDEMCIRDRLGAYPFLLCLHSQGFG